MYRYRFRSRYRGLCDRAFRRRKFRPPLPSTITGNSQSLRNKMDELKACTDYQYGYRDSCLMCFSETWFKSTDSPHTSEIEGFACERMDRTLDSNKLTGGGVCAYVNKRWCTDIKVKHTVCSPDIELLTISLCPFYLPREFNQIFITDVYN